ncbi:excalibur calcium-binding domain-containing protein [Marivivens marinus]|uniref:excalibur calcium-binding domain-containing protein n=1 Tax=Marivivens marinus TaxID=3110173 RepID=UPI003B8455AC
MKAMLFLLGLLCLPSSAAADPTLWDLLKPDAPLMTPIVPAQGYSCARKTCGQMVSCEEACYHLVICGDTARDRDNDGIPCENICSRPCPR